MAVTTRRRRHRWTDEEWAPIQARLDALMADVDRDVAVGRRLAEAWLAGRPYAENADRWWLHARSDGWSAFVHEDCVATWHPGPRRLDDPDIALVSDRRLQAGGFSIRVRSGFTDVLDERGVPFVRVVPPYPYRWAFEPKQLLDGWAASQAVVHLLETRAHEPAMCDFVWAWVHDDEDAAYYVPHHRCYVYDGSVIVDEACLLTRVPGSRRVVLLSARRYPQRTFQRLIQDALRETLSRHDLLVAEVRPRLPHRYVQAHDLLAAWEAEKLRAL